MNIAIFPIVLTAVLVVSSSGLAQYSALWGRDGQNWSPQSRLPDFSFAGYRRGEAPLPTVKDEANVKAFGAVGAASANIPAPSKKAIDAFKGKVIPIPPGRTRL